MRVAALRLTLRRVSIQRLLLLIAIALPLFAQEPRPARLLAASFEQTDEITMSLEWRYAPGDEAGREALAYDDSHWRAVKPALPPAADWNGVGWFRRHLQVGPGVSPRPVVLRFTAPGVARVYLDGQLVMEVGRNPAPPDILNVRSDAVLIRLDAGPHLLAVRYVYPLRPEHEFGFMLSLARQHAAVAAPNGQLVIVLRGAVLALPIFLALLHIGLFSFDPRAKENLWYSLEMFTFAAILVHEYREVLFAADAQRVLVDRMSSGLAILGILFGGLTYYALRTRPWPKSARLFIAAAVVLFPLAYLQRVDVDQIWPIFFAAFVLDVIRLELGGRVVKRKGSGFYLVSFAIFGLAIGLQILVNFGYLDTIAGVHEVYIFGILASAVGMSLYLASTLGQSRIHEAENERKTRELTNARELQLSMLPRAMPHVAGLDVAAMTQTAAEVGGDYYDVKRIGDDELLFAFGDATGHGLSAGIVVTAAKALFTSLDAHESPGALLAHCHRAMAEMNLPTLRMCLSLARVSPRGITAASAAMPPLLIHRAASDVVEELGTGGLPLGSRLAARFEERTAALSAGDVVLFASDGFAELTDPAGRQLGYDGVAESFRRASRAATARDVIEQLLADVAAFRATRPQDDDITFVVVRIGGGQSPASM